MPVKSTQQAPNDASGSNFVLKHRIVGAAVLLFFGALFLPWLLGAPSEASKTGKVSESENTPMRDQQAQTQAEKLEEELLSAIEGEQLLEQEQVYISRITPLDSNRNAVPEPASADAPSDSGAAAANGSPAKDAVDDSGSGISSKPPGATQQLANIQAQAADNISTGKSKAGKPDSSVSVSRPDGTAATVPDTATIEVGWVVQVGVFTDKRGAAKVVADLKAKGFNPATTIVDTNRGKLTGTRIWLGPFAQRVEAAKAKTRLTEMTGEAGFIRAFP